MKIKGIQMLLVLCMTCTAFFMTSCGTHKDSSFVTGQYYYPKQEELVEQTETGEEMDGEAEQEETLGADVFLITENDMQEECLLLEQLASGKQYMYYYSVATQFLDKYGNRTTVTEYQPGRIITIGKKDVQGRLMQAQISDEVWEYPNVSRYSVDEERGVFTIADSNYSYDENIFVHADGIRQRISDLTGGDTLRVVGMGKKILSVSVTTGHGELRLENTSLFEGSFIQIGSKIFSEITHDMKMELPEGNYTVTVANKGYGGSTEIEIRHGQETVLDLDMLKGEGPKLGNILFAVDVPEAVLQIDGKVVDYSEAVPISYGVHTLTVTADSYDTYSKKLFVNSKEATIVIGLSGEDSVGTGGVENAEKDTEDGKKDQAEGGKADAGSMAGSLAGSQSASSTNGNGTKDITSEAELDALVNSLLEKDKDKDEPKTDYLSTLTELLRALEKAK